MKRKIKPGHFEELIRFFSEKNEILTVYLFGSYGTEMEREHSDLDLGILFSTSLPLMEEMALAAEIEEIVESEVDLVSLNKVNILLKYKIIKTGSKIYESDPIISKMTVDIERLENKIQYIRNNLKKLRELKLLRTPM